MCHLCYCFGCFYIIAGDHPHSDASCLTSRHLLKKKEKAKTKQRRVRGKEKIAGK